MEIEKYEHHGREVSVFSELKGRHREHCLCWQNCKFFVPGNDLFNCPTAMALFDLDKEHGITTPVFECADYIRKED